MPACAECCGDRMGPEEKETMRLCPYSDRLYSLLEGEREAAARIKCIIIMKDADTF